jgi:kynurenine formamidase
MLPLHHRRLISCLGIVAALISGGCSSTSSPQPARFPAGEIVDLSHTYDAEAIFWPTAEGFRLEKVSDGITPGGYYYAANNFFAAEHGGTHIDAPLHFAQGHQSVDQIPLDRLIAPAVVVDVVSASGKQVDYLVTAEDLQQWERTHGQIPSSAILLIRTGFSKRWPDAVRYLGTAERGADAATKLHFPGLHPDAARWLAANRPVKAIGIDTASIDYGPSTTFESHRVL